MVKLVPNSFGSVREYNQCHVQSGRDGGRFCSATGTGGGAAPAAGSSGGPARTAATPSPGKTGEAPPTKPDAGEKPLPKLPPNFKELSPAQRDKLADVKRAVDRRVAELVGSEKWPSTGSMARDIGQRIKLLEDRMAPESQLLVRQMALDLHRQLVSAKGDTPSVRKLVQHATDVLSAQEIEATERVLGDHGVHHLEGDYRMALDTLKAKGPVTAADRASLMLAAIYHDTGYMTDPSRQWQDSDHPRWSAQYYDTKVKSMVASTLGQKMADELSTTIATHADTDMDWEAAPRTSAFRLGDNLALFHKEKIPALFRDVPENRTVMERWANGGMDTESARIEMQANIKKAALSPYIKRQLMRATEEVNDSLPKFLAGMWSGEVRRIEWDKEANAPVVNLINRGNTALMKRLDLGQKQFAKLAKTYGLQLGSFNQSPKLDFVKNGRILLRLRVRGRRLVEALRHVLWPSSNMGPEQAAAPVYVRRRGA